MRVVIVPDLSCGSDRPPSAREHHFEGGEVMGPREIGGGGAAAAKTGSQADEHAPPRVLGTTSSSPIVTTLLPGRPTRALIS